jgi:hypothetical protein
MIYNFLFKHLKKYHRSIIALVAALHFNCYQIYTLQNASLLPKKSNEYMGSYSLQPYYDHPKRKTSIVADQLGVHWKYGLTNSVTTTFTYTYSIPTYAYLSNVHFIAFGIKFPFIRNYLAFHLPLAIYLNKDIHSYNPVIVQPTLIASIPLCKNIKLNCAATDHFFLEKAIANTPCITSGFEFSNVFNLITIRPEFGFGTNQISNGLYYSFNIGISYILE